MIYIEVFNWMCYATVSVHGRKRRMLNRIVYRKISWRKHYFRMTGS